MDSFAVLPRVEKNDPGGKFDLWLGTCRQMTYVVGDLGALRRGGASAVPGDAAMAGAYTHPLLTST